MGPVGDFLEIRYPPVFQALLVSSLGILGWHATLKISHGHHGCISDEFWSGIAGRASSPLAFAAHVLRWFHSEGMALNRVRIVSKSSSTKTFNQHIMFTCFFDFLKMDHEFGCETTIDTEDDEIQDLILIFFLLPWLWIAVH